MRSPLDTSPALHDAPVSVIEPPGELRAFEQWVGWSCRPTTAGLAKVPHRLPPLRSAGGKALAQAASTTDPSTWASYEIARPHPRIGFVFTADDPFCGIDLDDCLDPDTGELTLVARVAIRYLASYAEISPSGKGIKVIARSSVPGKRRQNRKLGVEMYDEGRFFALTGNRLSGVPTDIAEADLTPLYRWIFGPSEAENPPAVSTEDGGRGRVHHDRCDEAIIRRALGAKNGHRFERLWRGDASGYPTRSEADLALCAMLAYWADADSGRVEALFSRSGLVREKWNSRPDYRKRTIERAISNRLGRQGVGR